MCVCVCVCVCVFVCQLGKQKLLLTSFYFYILFFLILRHTRCIVLKAPLYLILFNEYSCVVFALGHEYYSPFWQFNYAVKYLQHRVVKYKNVILKRLLIYTAMKRNSLSTSVRISGNGIQDPLYNGI